MSPSRSPNFVRGGPAIDRAPDATLTGTTAPPSVDRALAGGGRALEPAVRHEMEQHFGCDFFDVRVHDDALAAASARDIHAKAYAAGPHIVFAAGRYAPHAPEGRHLLAHELAHVVQQQGGGPAGATEERAEHAADLAMAGRAVDRRALGGAPAGIHAQPEDKAPAQDRAKPQESGKPDEGSAGNVRSFTKALDRFALGKDTLTAEHLIAIDELAFSISLEVGMLARGKARVEIVGHTDTSGAERHNQKLGRDRADRVQVALEKKLAGEMAPSVEWAVGSAGESAPLLATGDNQQEPRNRRVEVKVTIFSLPEPNRREPIKLFPEEPMPGQPKGPFRPEQDDIWKRMEENQRRLDELNRRIGKKAPKSAQDVLVDALAGTLDPLVNALPIPDSLKKKAREGIRDGIRAGSVKACEAAIDASGATGPEAQALKAACEAALKHKPGDAGGGSP